MRSRTLHAYSRTAQMGGSRGASVDLGGSHGVDRYGADDVDISASTCRSCCSQRNILFAALLVPLACVAQNLWPVLTGRVSQVFLGVVPLSTCKYKPVLGRAPSGRVVSRRTYVPHSHVSTAKCRKQRPLHVCDDIQLYKAHLLWMSTVLRALDAVVWSRHNLFIVLLDCTG